MDFTIENPVAELISVGTELLLGSIANTDAQMLSRELSGLGISVYHHTVVGDNRARLLDAAALAKSRANILLTTGGLGPTCDDLTKQVLSESFGKTLRFHAKSAKRLEAFFADMGQEPTANNYQQAMLPEGCTVFENGYGTAPGCAFFTEGILVIMLPGPPQECEAMFLSEVKPYLQAHFSDAIVSRSVRIFGMGESAAESKLREKMNAMENPTLAPYCKEGEVEFRITAKAENSAKAHALLEPVEKDLQTMFGDLIYSVELPSLEALVSALLREKKLRLGAAESCTGGLIAKRMTDLPGASDVFCGSIVSYGEDVKRSLLRIPPEVLSSKQGAVTAETACRMAQSARELLGCDIAVSATGVAGDSPDQNGNPAGLVYIAISAENGTWVREIRSGVGRARVRTMAANHAFDLARRYLGGLDLVASEACL